MKKKITPVLLGADLNCYSVARAFHEACGAVSYAFGKYASGESAHSYIIKFRTVPYLSDRSVMTELLLNFAQEHSAEELFLIACTDEYQAAVIESRKTLEKYYFCACPDADLAQKLITKEAFYQTCGEHALPFPKTVIVTRESDGTVFDEPPFAYPAIIKPSDSAAYWRAPFEGMKKVYTADSPGQAREICARIFAAGYDGNIIFQEKICGAEDDMYVLTAYCDKYARVRMACMGHVLLGEHTPKGLGNHVAVLTENHAQITKKITDFLEDIGYRGFANFDIIRDRRNGAFKILEINLRQGRSNYYVTAAGINIAELLIRDASDGLKGEKNICDTESFWHTVPKRIIYRYIGDKELKSKIKQLVKAGRSRTALFYARDTVFNPMRLAYVFIHNIRYFKKYRIYG